MTEVPDAILWIASVGLIILTILMAAILIVLLVIFSQVKKLITKMQEIADPIRQAAESAGNTVTTFSNSLLRPLATVVGAMAGFRRGSKNLGKRFKR